MEMATARTDSVTETLQADHRRLDGLLSRAQASLGRGDLATARLEFTAFHDGLLRHIRIEEDLLFPEFEAATGTAGGGPTSVMRFEHAAIQRLLVRMKAELESATPDEAGFERLRSELVGVLSSHNFKEERILYPTTDRKVPPARLRELLATIRDRP